MTQSFVSLLLDDDGATLVEYSLVICFIALACIATMSLLGTKISNSFASFAAAFPA